METVSIVLSTYNGEKYILEQLNSIARQTYKDIVTYIHDDGSSDKTVSIIRSFIKDMDLTERSTIRFMLLNDENRLGYPLCFVKPLLSLPDTDYYAFCDQDDVWNEDKIETAVRKLEKLDNREPVLYYSAVDYVDANLNFVRSSRFAQYAKDVKNYGLQEYMYGGEAMGMTYVFNQQVRRALQLSYEQGKRNYKDGFIKLYAAACGKVVYDKKPCAKYRRHENAVTNHSNPSGMLSRYLGEAKRLMSQDGSAQRDMLSFIIKNYSNEMELEDLKLAKLMATPKNRLSKCLWHGRFRVRMTDEICYRILFLLGKA